MPIKKTIYDPRFSKEYRYQNIFLNKLQIFNYFFYMLDIF